MSFDPDAPYGEDKASTWLMDAYHMAEDKSDKPGWNGIGWPMEDGNFLWFTKELDVEIHLMTRERRRQMKRSKYVQLPVTASQIEPLLPGFKAMLRETRP